MDNDLDLLVYNFPNTEDINIIPVGDVHLGSMQCKETEWASFCKRISESDNTYLILIGDLIDMALKNSKSDVYAQSYSPMEGMTKMVEYLRPIKDKILCITEGNHEGRLTRDTNFSPTYLIANELGISDKVRLNMAFIQIRMGESCRHLPGKARPSYSICAYHGAAKTRHNTLSYAVGTDIMVTGHTHENLIIPRQRIEIDSRNKRAMLKDVFQLSVSSWLEWGGYGMTKTYLPQPTMLQTIHLKGNRKKISVTLN